MRTHTHLEKLGDDRIEVFVGPRLALWAPPVERLRCFQSAFVGCEGVERASPGHPALLLLEDVDALVRQSQGSEGETEWGEGGRALDMGSRINKTRRTGNEELTS